MTKTWDSIRRDVAAFHDEHGHRPTQIDLRNHDAWLARRGSSLSKLCDEMGLTEHRPVGGAAPKWKHPHRYAADEVKERIRTFYREHGRRPYWAEMKKDAEYLSRNGASLTDLCDDLGIPRRGDERRLRGPQVRRVRSVESTEE